MIEKKIKKQLELEERKRQDNFALEKLLMELKFKSLQLKLEADRKASQGEASHKDRHLPNENSSVRAARTRIRRHILCPEKNEIDLRFVCCRELSLLAG